MDLFTQILGLDICKDTMVGDEMVRGISGGQKKRVTTGFNFLCSSTTQVFYFNSMCPESHDYNSFPQKKKKQEK